MKLNRASLAFGALASLATLAGPTVWAGRLTGRRAAAQAQPASSSPPQKPKPTLAQRFRAWQQRTEVKRLGDLPKTLRRTWQNRRLSGRVWAGFRGLRPKPQKTYTIRAASLSPHLPEGMRTRLEKRPQRIARNAANRAAARLAVQGAQAERARIQGSRANPVKKAQAKAQAQAAKKLSVAGA